jgi:hypothetical protein
VKPLFAAALVASALACQDASAQFVKGNEAVSSTAAGNVILTPPVPASVGRICAANAKCHAGAWRMVETETGLMECTEPWARLGSCRASTFGSQKMARVWVVKTGGIWAQCQYPDLSSKCTPIFARPPANLPFDAVQ